MRHLGALMLLLLAVMSCRAQKSVDWLPVTQQDWEVKDVPVSPGAPAIQLYYSYYKDDNDAFISVYRRIKVLRENGRRYADVEIQIEPGVSLKELAARTLHQDGTIADFKGKPFEKTIIKTRGIKFTAKTFTLPYASAGSIVEYKYTLGLPPDRVNTISEWELQGDLYTLKADFRFRAFQGVVLLRSEWSSVSNTRYSQVAYAYLNQLDARPPEKKKGNLMELHVENVPAFTSEEYMPPEDDFKPSVFFYYGGHAISSPDKYWEQLGKDEAVWIEKFIGNSQQVRDLATQTIGTETDPEKKLRKLYARAQQFRNTSFERERTEEKQKREKLKANENVQDVLNHGWGTSFDICALFVALARTAGFEANVVFVSDRKYRSFQRLVLSPDQIDTAAVQVTMNSKGVVLSPGTRYCPFGLLPWEHSSVTALELSKTGARFVTTPAPETSLAHRTAKTTLSADGSLKGEITLELKGQDALEHRLAALKTDEAGRRKDFEDEILAALPEGAMVKLKDSQGWDSADDPLIVRFDLNIPNYASTTGKRLIAPALLFPTFQKDMFIHDSRTYPIVFPYPFTEIDEVDIRLPDGFTLEAPPYRRKAGLSYAGYEVASSFSDNHLVTRRSLRLDGISFPPEQYFELKNFFNTVQAGDGGHAIFTSAAAVSAEQKD